jgi:signal transduction histidine kinase
MTEGKLETIPRLRGTLPPLYWALLVVPIRVHDGLYGCLLLFYTQPSRFIEEVTLAQIYADQVALAITNARLQRHLEQEAASVERDRIARELHDTVTQEIYSARLITESLLENWQTHREEAEAGMRQLDTSLLSAHAGLRALLLELRPATLEQSTLAESLRHLGVAMSARAGVPIAVELTGVARPEPQLPAAVKVTCYRVAQEALMNAAKYARAHAISVRLWTAVTQDGNRPELEMEIADDGRGFELAAVPAGHFGLAMMRERTCMVGADLKVTSQIGQGTRIVVAWSSTRQVRTPAREGALSDD